MNSYEFRFIGCNEIEYKKVAYIFESRIVNKHVDIDVEISVIFSNEDAKEVISKFPRIGEIFNISLLDKDLLNYSCNVLIKGYGGVSFADKFSSLFLSDTSICGSSKVTRDTLGCRSVQLTADISCYTIKHFIKNIIPLFM